MMQLVRDISSFVVTSTFIAGILLLIFNTTVQELVKSIFVKKSDIFKAELARDNIQFQVKASEYAKAIMTSINEINSLMLRVYEMLESCEAGRKGADDLTKIDGIWEDISKLKNAFDRTHIFLNEDLNKLIEKYINKSRFLRARLLISYHNKVSLEYMEKASESFVSGAIKLKEHQERRETDIKDFSEGLIILKEILSKTQQQFVAFAKP